MRRLFIILSTPDREAWAQEVIAAADSLSPFALVATPREAASYLAANQISPSHVILDIGARGSDVLAEIDALAQQCEPGTRVVAVGDTNDILLYREMISRGVLDYFPMPAASGAIISALTAPPVAAKTASPSSTGREKRVIVFMSAASGDGASTAALNTAYALSQLNVTATPCWWIWTTSLAWWPSIFPCKTNTVSATCSTIPNAGWMRP